MATQIPKPNSAHASTEPNAQGEMHAVAPTMISHPSFNREVPSFESREIRDVMAFTQRNLEVAPTRQSNVTSLGLLSISR